VRFAKPALKNGSDAQYSIYIKPAVVSFIQVLPHPPADLPSAMSKINRGFFERRGIQKNLD